MQHVTLFTESFGEISSFFNLLSMKKIIFYFSCYTSEFSKFNIQVVTPKGPQRRPLLEKPENKKV
jgi:hypothetical protein